MWPNKDQKSVSNSEIPTNIKQLHGTKCFSLLNPFPCTLYVHLSISIPSIIPFSTYTFYNPYLYEIRCQTTCMLTVLYYIHYNHICHYLSNTINFYDLWCNRYDFSIRNEQVHRKSNRLFFSFTLFFHKDTPFMLTRWDMWGYSKGCVFFIYVNFHVWKIFYVQTYVRICSDGFVSCQIVYFSPLVFRIHLGYM